jgi:hypothetical protein
MNSKTVTRTSFYTWDKAMPDSAGLVWQSPASFGTVGISDAEIHRGRIVGEERDVDSAINEGDP